jgi:hypothetical protein
MEVGPFMAGHEKATAVKFSGGIGSGANTSYETGVLGRGGQTRLCCVRYG